MNCLLIFPEEVTGPGEAILTGSRAGYAIENHGLVEGLELKAGELGGKLGRARVVSISGERIRLCLELRDEPPQRMPVDLLLAVPRPQTVKKVLQLGACAGVRSISFIPSEKGVKSYIQSKTLLEESINAELLLGLEQGADTLFPGCRIYKSLTDYLSILDANREPAVKFLADTRAEIKLHEALDARDNARTGCLMAVGPEAGWSETEMERFSRRGFEPVSLGQRMYRVDVAIALMLGQFTAALKL